MNQNDYKFPAEESRDVADLMQRKYGAFLKDRFFEIKADSDSYGVFVTVTLRNSSSTFHYPVEARMAHASQEFGVRDATLFLFDYIDLYFQEFLKEGESVYLPIDWSDYECEGVKLQLRGQIQNLAVEKMADDLLSGKDHSLPRG